MVTWDVVTTDYVPPSQGGPTPSELREQVLDRAQAGSIVVLHLGGYPTYAALPAIVAGLRARGLEPVTLDELLRLDGETSTPSSDTRDNTASTTRST